MARAWPARWPEASSRKSARKYLEHTFPRLNHLRPGEWEVSKGIGGRSAIAQFDQYEHLAALEAASKANPELAAALGSDYLIKPDVVVIRSSREGQDHQH